MISVLVAVIATLRTERSVRLCRNDTRQTDLSASVSLDAERPSDSADIKSDDGLDELMAFDIKAWTDYGVAVVGGAAALTGLLFVAVSVNSAWFYSSQAHRGRAGQALVLFVMPLVSGILLLIPGQSPTALGIEIVVFGVLVGRVLIALGTEKVVEEPRSMALVDRLSPRVITTVALIAGGLSLIIGRFGGLYWLAAVDVCALLAGLLNAWVFLLAAGAAKAN